MNLYDILGVPRDATPEQIKAAHRAKAKRWHPDAGGNPEAFQRIQHAYDTLSDPDERAYYDRTGQTGFKDSADRIDTQARDFFAKILLQALEDTNATRLDIIGKGKAAAASERHSIKRQIADMAQRRDRAEKLAKRFKAKDGKGTLPNDIYAHVARDMIRAIEEGEERIKVMDRLDQLLDGYEFEREPGPTAPDRSSILTQDLINQMFRAQQRGF